MAYHKTVCIYNKESALKATRNKNNIRTSDFSMEIFESLRVQNNAS